jgi:hypothetical protein
VVAWSGPGAVRRTTCFVSDMYVGARCPAPTSTRWCARSRIATRRPPGVTPPSSLPVVFTPSGLSAILLPLEGQALQEAVLRGFPLGAGGRAAVRERFARDIPCPAVGVVPVDDEGPCQSPAARARASCVDSSTISDRRCRKGQYRPRCRGAFGKPRVSYSGLIWEEERRGKGGSGGLLVGSRRAAHRRLIRSGRAT